MYPHHKASLEILKNHFSSRAETIAIIFGGSVAKGNERIDSDLDAMIVVSEEDYAKRLAANATAETVTGMCTYEGGYFDVKYMTKAYLLDAAEKGSEPTRNSFVKAQVIYTRDPDIPEIVSRIPVFQKALKEEKMLSFYSDMVLHHQYFLKCCPIEGYMKLFAVGEVLYCVYRMILQENEVLFPCNRRLEETVAGLVNKPEGIVELGKRLAQTQEVADADAFVERFLAWSTWEPPQDLRVVLSRYTADFEQWWRVPRPLVHEW